MTEPTSGERNAAVDRVLRDAGARLRASAPDEATTATAWDFLDDRGAGRRRLWWMAPIVLAAAAASIVAVVVITRSGETVRDVPADTPAPTIAATVPAPTIAATVPTPTIAATLPTPTSAAPTTAPAATTTEAPTTSIRATPPTAAVFDQVIWPGPEHAQFDDGVAAARSFVEEFVGMANAPLGELRLAEPDVGEVDVHGLTESGAVRDAVVSTITVRRFDGHWYVTGAVADEVQIDAPVGHAEVTSPLRVQGRGRGYEGTIVVEVRDAFQPAGRNLGQAVALAGCCDELVPFDAVVTLSPPSGRTGAIVASTDTGAEHGIVDFTVIPVRFAPTSTETDAVTTLRVFLTASSNGSPGPLVEVRRTVPATTGVLRASLVALLDGPTVEERAAGLMSWFPDDTGDAVEAVSITDGQATVRLSYGPEDLPHAAPPDGVLAQLNATVFQFDNVQAVRYELGGDCAAFDAWLGRGCEFTRFQAPASVASLCPEDWLDGVAALQAEVDAGHQPWRASAIDVATACTFGQPDATAEPAGENTFRVTELSTGQTVLVTVTQPLRTGDSGVWVVTSVVPVT